MDDRISVCYESKNVTHYRIPAGKGGGPMVTVRTSVLSAGHFTCLSCVSNDCRHAKAARAFDRARTPHTESAA